KTSRAVLRRSQKLTAVRMKSQISYRALMFDRFDKRLAIVTIEQLSHTCLGETPYLRAVTAHPIFRHLTSFADGFSDWLERFGVPNPERVVETLCNQSESIRREVH